MMQPSLEILQPLSTTSFQVRTFNEEAFKAPYHFHPEYELTLILRGEGKRFVGNHMKDYAAGDLVLLGVNLPHCWKTGPAEQAQKKSVSIVVQFTDGFMGRDFFSRPELRDIRQLLQKSSYGLQFSRSVQQHVKPQMIRIAKEKNDFRKFMILLEILQYLAISEEYELLNKQKTIAERPSADRERINPVFSYLVENFRQDISLKKAAETAHMTPNAFCKYFKKITRKTFMETVIDYRVNYAIQQLAQTAKPVSQICFESGFGDISHFYKTFKARMGLSPLKYREKFNKTL